MEKICRTCQRSKPLADFTRDRQNKDGRRGDCKVCNSRWNRTYKTLRKASRTTLAAENLAPRPKVCNFVNWADLNSSAYRIRAILIREAALNAKRDPRGPDWLPRNPIKQARVLYRRAWASIQSIRTSDVPYQEVDWAAVRAATQKAMVIA